MRKISYAMLVSLDGYIEAADGSILWTNPDEELHRHFNDRDRETSLFLYGRRMYENMAAYWPTADEDPSAPELMKEYARIWRDKPKVVFSRTLERVEWNARLVRGDIAKEVRRLKEEPGKDMSVSGAGIASSFMRRGLIDEVCLYLHPVLLGGGKPMFGSLRQLINFQLVDTHPFARGIMLLRYQRRP